MEKQSKDYEKNENDWTDREIQSETLSFMTSAMIKDIFKQTEIGEWEEAVFSEAIDVNPKRELKKGQSAKCVSMIDIEPFKRKISNFSIKEFKGGSKFRNKDTLFARITPCLENGKTAFVDILDNGEIGFGSTEFIVLSAKEEKTDSYFVYYLSRSPEIRKVAIKSMTGTSGRQRVENEVFDTIIINLPPVSEQSSIAKILSDLDSKIELNQQMNKTLESIGHAIFKHWFVDFEFPNEKGKPYKSSGGEMVDSELGKIPKGWEVGKLGDLGKIQPGFAFKSKDFLDDGIGLAKIKNIQPPIVDFNFESYISEELYNETNNRFYLFSGDILIAMTGAKIGKIGIIPKTENKILLNQRVGKVESNNKYLMYLILNTNEIQELISGGSSASSAQGNISNSDIENFIYLIPKEIFLQKINKVMNCLFVKMIDNLGEIQNLSQIRDSLLPKLMSGKIRVPVKTNR